MLAKFRWKLILLSFLSIFLVISIISLISFNIVVLDHKYKQEISTLDKMKKQLVATNGNSTSLSLFNSSEQTSAILGLLENNTEMSIYITHLNNHINAINSLNKAKKLLSNEDNNGLSAMHLVTTVITEQLEILRGHALKHSALLSSYEDRYLKEAVFLLENISTSTMSAEERQKVLGTSYHHLVEQAQSTTNKIMFEFDKMKELSSIILYSAAVFCLLILLLQINITLLLLKKTKEINSKVLFIRHYLRENNGSDHNNYSDNDGLESLFNEAKISVGVLVKRNDLIDELYGNIHNSNALASLLGYEVNALTSIVAGGLLLNKKEETEESAFDQEVYGALTSLENLSDNFNHLFTSKEQYIDLDKEFNMHEQLNKMFILLNSKCRGLNKEFDFIIDNSVPIFAGGDAYRFYWCLYNVLVRCIEDVDQSKCIIHVSIKEGTSIENKTLQIKLISISDEHPNLTTLLDYVNQEKVVSTELFNINAQLYERILNSFFEGGVSFKETNLGDSVIVVDLIITPKNYGAKLPKVEANVLVCAAESLQTSIILDKINQTGAEVALCDNKDALLKIIAKAQDLDFIFISDVFSSNPSLIKVIQKRTKACVVLLSTLNKVRKVHLESTEEIVNLPLSQTKILKLLSEKETVTEAKEKEFNILVVDDDPSQQFILSHFLKRVGIVPVLADNCDSAIELIKENSFDLVFMDCIMPGKDGFETTSMIREYEASLKHEGKLEKAVTIVGNTSLTASNEIDKCIKCGMDAVLNKPYKHDKILEILTRYN